MLRSMCLVFAVLVGLQSVASVQLSALSQWNQRQAKKYNDIWGYVDSEGREYALLGVRDGTSVLEVTDPTRPREIGFIPSSQSVWKDIKTLDHYAYVVNETGGGMQILDLSQLPNSVSLVSTFTGFRTSHNLYIDEAKALLYAEGNHGQPVRVYSLEDPLSPRFLGFFGVECHDIMVQDGLAYISEGGHGTIGIFDVNRRGFPLVNRFLIPNSGYVHNAWINEAGTSLATTEETTNKSIKIWDVANKNEVQLLGEYLGPNKLAHNAFIKGHKMYVSHYGAGLRIVDLLDPANPREVAYFIKGQSVPRGFVSAWGVYPYLPSGNILISDIESGLYIVSESRVQS